MDKADKAWVCPSLLVHISPGFNEARYVGLGKPRYLDVQVKTQLYLVEKGKVSSRLGRTLALSI